MAAILAAYVKYVNHLRGESSSVDVVWDGYDPSTKDHEHRRRDTKSCPDITIQLDNSQVVAKAAFLSNKRNTTRLIKELSNSLKVANIGVIQCDDDADTQVVTTAITLAEHKNVHVKAQDH